ncbi:unnamed protein product [Blepharisma stoltei]|uniref:Uncharacterized protein n=1 Tax=Blepharisma stoltei TaxID=1481888 RepID=A0AAU9IAG7_9CILI|nr:unnamed protein product [Blepharisma stoltei]
MERTVPIKARVNDQLVTIDSLPTSWEDLLNAIHHLGHAINFTVFWNDHPITNKRELALAYLNNKGDEIIFEAKQNPNPMTSMDESVKADYDNMISQFTRFSTSDEAPSEPLTLQNGILSKENLLMVVRSLTLKAKDKLFESGRKFIEKRQEFYGTDEEKYRSVVMEQLQFQELLILTCSAETFKKHGIPSEAFDNSVRTYQNDADVKEAIENMSIEAIQGSGDVPEGLTEEKLKEMLFYSCDFINQYLAAHPLTNPMEVMVLKSRESDEVLKRFGFDELQISAAMTKYDIEKNPNFEDIRKKLNEVTTKIFGFNPSEMPR